MGYKYELSEWDQAVVVLFDEVPQFNLDHAWPLSLVSVYPQRCSVSFYTFNCTHFSPRLGSSGDNLFMASYFPQVATDHQSISKRQDKRVLLFFCPDTVCWNQHVWTGLVEIILSVTCLCQCSFFLPPVSSPFYSSCAGCVIFLQVQWLSSKRRPRAQKESLRPVPKGQGQWRQTQRCAHPQHATGQQSTCVCARVQAHSVECLFYLRVISVSFL